MRYLDQLIMLCEPVWIHDGVDKREWFEKGLSQTFSLMI